VSVVRAKPHPNMIAYYHVAFAATYALVLSIVVLPIALLAPELLAHPLMAACYIALAAVAAFYIYWVGRYYESIEYVVEADRLIARRGVWWRRESVVPLSKVNNVVLSQGPLMRALGLANLAVHTAAMGLPRPEAMLSYLSYSDAVKLREEILSRARTAAPRPPAPPRPEAEILEELRRIRRLLEERLER